MREGIMAEAILALEKQGFHVSSFSHANTCFDLVARKGTERLIVKFYGNIDAVRSEQAEELKRIAAAFGATAFIVGEKTKKYNLENRVVYDRYDIPSITIMTFRGVIEGTAPEKRFFKGKTTVSLDSGKMKEKRIELGISREKLAIDAGITIESIHRYEKGFPATLEIARKIEEALESSLIETTELLERHGEGKLFDDNFDDPVLEKLSELGMKIAQFRKAPFKAYSKAEEPTIIQRVTYRSEIRQAAEDAGKMSQTFESEAFIVAKESKRKSFENIPIISEDELDCFSKAGELLKEIRERKK